MITDLIPGFQPMLSANKGADKGPVQVSDIVAPCYASIKLDGIRALNCHGKSYSRKLLETPNRHVQRLLSDISVHGLDGELVSGEVTAEDCYLKTYSAVQSEDGEPEFTYWVFDRWDLHYLPFEDRMNELMSMRLPSYVKVLDQKWIESHEDLIRLYSGLVDDGHEGLITKAKHGKYKFGRSTVKENWMCKLKPRVDSECEILDFIELERNTNEATIDERGYVKRSKAQAGMVAGGTLGKVRVRDIHSGVVFMLGGGKLFTAKVRQEMWDNPDAYSGRFIRYSSCPVGVKDLPRQATADGWRDEGDMS